MSIYCYLVNSYDMAPPTMHSITKGLMKLQKGEWRAFIGFRGVHEVNKRQAEAHLANCSNIDTLQCRCFEIK